MGGRAGDAEAIDAMFFKALDCMERGDPGEAIVLFEAILKDDPLQAEARHGLIRALEDAGRVDDALDAVKALIAAEPDDVLAVTRLSMIYQHKGMVAEAEAAASRAKILGWKVELRGGLPAKTDL